MNCPYCNKEMEFGVIQSPQELRWQKYRHFFTTKRKSDVLLSERNIWRGCAVKSAVCKNCKKIIIDYDEVCDVNKMKKIIYY